MESSLKRTIITSKLYTMRSNQIFDTAEFGSLPLVANVCVLHSFLSPYLMSCLSLASRTYKWNSAPRIQNSNLFVMIDLQRLFESGLLLTASSSFLSPWICKSASRGSSPYLNIKPRQIHTASRIGNNVLAILWALNSVEYAFFSSWHEI